MKTENMRFQPQVKSEDSQVLSMQDVWDKIYNKADNKNQFLRESWYEAWDKYIKDSSNWDKDTSFLYAISGTDHAVIFPYSIQNVGPFNFASLCGNFYPCRGIPNTGVDENLVKVTISELAKIENVHGYRFGPIDSSDQFQSEFLEELKRQKWPVVVKSYGSDFGKELPASEEDYLKTISRKRRKKANYYRRKMENEGDVEFKYYNNETSAHWESVFQDLEKVEKRSWVAYRGVPRFIGENNQNFWNSLVADDWFSKSIKVIIIYFNGEPISHDVSIDAGDHRFGYDSSYDEAFSRFAPGMLLEMENSKQAIKFGIKNVNNGYGTDDFKKRWGATELSEVIDVFVFPSTLKGRLICSIVKLKLFLDSLRLKDKFRALIKKDSKS